MLHYADYYSDVPGGSASGRSVEPSPFDMNSLGEDKDLILSGDLSAPVPMPITGGDFKWMNLMARKPLKAFPRIFKRVAQGVGGMAFGKDYTASGKALAAGLYSGAKKAGVDLWNDTPLVDLVIENGKAVGVVVERNGQEVRIAANRAVILAAGGFDRNIEKRRISSPRLLKADGSSVHPATRATPLTLLRSMDWTLICSTSPGGSRQFRSSRKALARSFSSRNAHCPAPSSLTVPATASSTSRSTTCVQARPCSALMTARNRTYRPG